MQPLYEVVPIHQGHRDKVEPGGRSVNIFRTPRIDTFPEEFLALFPREDRVLGRLWSIQRYEGYIEPVVAIVENTDLLQANLPRQINQSEEGELQESIQGQRRCKIECASPVFRSKIDEADWGDEPQECDRYPDDDELDQSVANHCLQRSLSSFDDDVGYHLSTQGKPDVGSAGPRPDKEGNIPEVAETGFPARPHTRHNLQQRSNGEKEEQDSKLRFFPRPGLLMTVGSLLDHGVGTANASLRTRKVCRVLTHPTHLTGELTISLGFFSVDAAPKG